MRPYVIKLIAWTARCTTILWALPVLAQADVRDRLVNVGVAAGYNQADRSALPRATGQIIAGFLALLGVAFLAYTVYAGWLWLTAAGNDEQITKAKRILRAALMGMIIVLGAYLITRFVIELAVQSGVYNI